MQGRLVLDTHADIARAAAMGISNPRKKHEMRDLVSGDAIVCATGVTDGPLVAGVDLGKSTITTETVVYHSFTGTVRRIRAEHHAGRMQD